MSADEKRAKIWHFIGRSSADCRPTVGGVNEIALVDFDYRIVSISISISVFYQQFKPPWLDSLYYFSSVLVAEWSRFGNKLLSRLTICSLCILTICNFSYFSFWS